MKMIKAVFLFSSLLLPLCGRAQSDVRLIKYGTIFEEKKEFRPIKGEGIDYDKATGEVRVGLTKVDFAEELNIRGEGGKIAFVSGQTSTQFNQLLVFSFLPDLMFKDLFKEAFSVEGREFRGSSEDPHARLKTKSITEMRKTYPAYYRPSPNEAAERAGPLKFQMKGGAIAFLQDLDAMSKNDEVRAIRLASPGEGLVSSQCFFTDDASSTVTTYLGRKTKEKYSTQKYLVFATYGYATNPLNSFEVTLPFPRNLSASLLVR